MRLFRSPHVSTEHHRFYVITQWAYIIGFVGHILAYLNFSGLHIREMVLVNAFYSIPCFAIAFILNYYGKHNTAFFIAFIELLAHQVLATYYLGWASGAHYWLIYLAGLCFFNPKWSTRLQLGLLGLVLTSFILMYFNFQSGVYELDERVLYFNRLSSALVTITIISLLINYYSRAARKSEQKLADEKEKTAAMLDKVEALFGQQVSEEIARELITKDLDFSSRQYDVSVMFLDIRDFTAFADSHQPGEVAELQNAVFSQLIEIVKKYRGVVLQILGDGIMAVFGAPNENSHHSDDAVRAGQEMLISIQELCSSGKIPAIKVGIGINSGQVIAGNVGNRSRRFYSLTGKHVIIAARIEQLNKQFESEMLISEFTYNRLAIKPNVHNLGPIRLKGIENEVVVFKLA